MKPHYRDQILKNIQPIIASLDYSLLKYKIGQSAHNDLMYALHGIWRDLVHGINPGLSEMIWEQMKKYKLENETKGDES